MTKMAVMPIYGINTILRQCQNWSSVCVLNGEYCNFDILRENIYVNDQLDRIFMFMS